MSENICQPYDECNKLSGQVLINNTRQWPVLAGPFDFILSELGGKVTMHPYFRFTFHQTWTPQEACHAPARSIIGLAPGEPMTCEMHQVNQFDFTRLIQETIDKSETCTQTGMIDPEMAELKEEEIEAIEDGDIAKLLEVEAEIKAEESDMDEILQSITRSQSRRTVSETTTSRSTLYERNIQRIFTNPYRNRSMQLRLIPVFRRFTVTTVFYKFDHGFCLDLHKPVFQKKASSASLGDFIQRMIVDPRIVSIAASELGQSDFSQTNLGKGTAAPSQSPLLKHLNANAEFYAKRYLRYIHGRHDLETLQDFVLHTLKNTKISRRKGVGDIKRVIRWPGLRVLGKGIYIPTALSEYAIETYFMKEKTKRQYFNAITKAEALLKRPKKMVRDVHLFIGTHIEPVPGKCKLSGIV